MVRHFSTSFTLLLITLDTLAVSTAILLAEYLRKTLPYGKTLPSEVWDTSAIFYVLLPLTWFVILYANKAYAPYQTYRAVLEIVTVFRCGIVATLLMPSLVYFIYR